ncbi:hypothetical protein [Methanolobus sp.]|nr:hypothetical protein [Methanolobus sp.]
MPHNDTNSSSFFFQVLPYQSQELSGMNNNQTIDQNDHYVDYCVIVEIII